MALPMTRVIGYNLNTRGINIPVERQQTLDARFMPRRPKGIRRPGTNYIDLLEAPTPTPGIGDPRVLGKRIVYQSNTATITD